MCLELFQHGSAMVRNRLRREKNPPVLVYVSRLRVSKIENVCDFEKIRPTRTVRDTGRIARVPAQKFALFFMEQRTT